MQLEDEFNTPSGEDAPVSDHGPSNKHHPAKDHHAESHEGGHHEEGEEGEGPWLLSYADMVTLLMCFFILFFSTNKNKGKYDEPQKVLARLKKLVTEANEEENAEDEPPPSSEDVPSSVALDTVFALGFTAPDTVEVVLLTSNMFLPGLAELTADGKASVEAVAKNLMTMPARSLIEIEGHTDSVPIKNSKFMDNWELSTARANSVLRVLEKKGISPQRMRTSGLAHFQPLVPEKDKRGFPILSNQAINRRIVIRLKMNPPKDKKQKNQPDSKKKG